MSIIRVVVVADHIGFREGLIALLRRVATVEIVGVAGATVEAIAMVQEIQPDVVLIDLDLPAQGGPAAIAQINAVGRATKVLALAMESDDEHLRDAIAAGSRGYLLKDAAPNAIVRAIEALHAGQLIFDPGVSQRVLATTWSRTRQRPLPALTDREYEILGDLARGLQDEVIAAQLSISTKTVQNNVSSILLKLGARDRAQAVTIAHDAGIARRPERKPPTAH